MVQLNFDLTNLDLLYYVIQYRLSYKLRWKFLKSWLWVSNQRNSVGINFDYKLSGGTVRNAGLCRRTVR